jgi:rod shape-determining protein MreC
MENLITRYRNVSILVAVLFAQVLGLAVQVRRTSENESSRLIRVWVVSVVTPMEKGIVWAHIGVSNLWRNYVYLRGVRVENRELKDEIERLRLEQVRMNEDAQQARRLQALLNFKEQFISQTVAAQVIGSSGSEQSRSIYIDKGSHAGIRPDMAVITADGVVGKVLRVYDSPAQVSQVLLLDDPSSGIGAILEKSRLQGIVKGTRSGDVVLDKVMADEQVPPGEKVLTSGGDQVFPKGLSVGTVIDVSKGPESFLKVRIKPAANLGKLEEVLVITKQENQQSITAETSPIKAADILAQRLPSVPDKPAEDTKKPASGTTAGAKPGSAGTQPQSGTAPKPRGNNAAPTGQVGNATAPKNNPTGTTTVLAPAKNASASSAPKKTVNPADTVPKPEKPKTPESQPAPEESKPQ